MNRVRIDKRIGLAVSLVLSVASSACTSTSASSIEKASSKQAADANEGSERTAQARRPNEKDPSQAAGSSSQPSAPGQPSAAQEPGLPEKEAPLRPRPMDMHNYEMPVDVVAQLSPTCVEPGAEMVLEVQTESEAAIGYQAVYAGNKGGGGVPFGEGYGGNDKGNATKEGTWSSSWTVRADAPRGPARVDVVVGFEGEFGYTGPHFAVADRDGNCPSRWLKSGPDEE